MTRYDVVTLGETMLRLTPPNLRRLEQTAHLDVEVGGTESNLAIGLARLGLKSLWLSRLTANPRSRTRDLRILFRGFSRSVCVVSISRLSGLTSDF